MCSEIINYLKQHWNIITYCLILFLMIIILLIFFKVDINCGKITRHSIIGWGMENNTIFASLEVGLLSFLATIYTNNRTIKLMKLSLKGTAELKTELELELLLHTFYKKLDKKDEMLTFIHIFDLINGHESEFKIIAPQSHNKMRKFITILMDDLDKNIGKNEISAKYVILDLISLIIERKENKICIKKIYNFNKIWNPAKFNNEYQIEPNKENLRDIINKIDNPELRAIIMNVFNDYCKLCKEFIEDLEKELKKLD